jgi:short-subunit dehydrogenase
MSQTHDSSKQTILVTGATAGIGRDAALYLAARGHRVIATGRKQALLDELRAAHRGAGQLETLRLDVDDRASIAEAARAVHRLTDGRGLDVLVNNAGYGVAGPLAEVPEEDLRAQFETNVFGLMAVTRAFLPAMMARGSGRVINVSSIGGRVTFPFFGAYNATKYAVESMSDALRAELAPFGIQVAIIEPGPVRTEFADRTMGFVDRYSSASSPWAGVYARAHALRKQTDAQSVEPIRVSRAIAHAATARRPRARYVVPWSANLLLSAMAWLPTALTDWIVRRVVGLVAANVRRPAPPPAPARRPTPSQATAAAS